MTKELLDNINKIANKSYIREIYLFGSVARGDEDQYSDVDILFVIDDCSEDEYIKRKDEFARSLDIPASWISVYRITKIINMYRKGSYFLWHIKSEGKVIYSRENELSTMLDSLPPYTNVWDDLEEYTEILLDIKKELNNEFISIKYELAVLASLIRNTCIAISYLNGRLDFSRNSVVMYCFSKYHINVSLNEYEELYQYRLFQTGKIASVPEAEKGQLKKWIDVEGDLLQIAKEGVINYEKEII